MNSLSPATTAPDPTPLGKPRPGVVRVLAVDDSPADRQLTTIRLGEIWPFEKELSVIPASSGEEAMEKIAGSRFSLVVLDWNLPQMTGAAVLKALRAVRRRVPVVVLSGQARDEIDCDLEAYGAAYVNKNDLDARTFENAIARSFVFVQNAIAPA